MLLVEAFEKMPCTGFTATVSVEMVCAVSAILLQNMFGNRMNTSVTVSSYMRYSYEDST